MSVTNSQNQDLVYPVCKQLYEVYPKIPKTIIRSTYTYVREQCKQPHLKKQPNGLSPKQLTLFLELMELED